MDAGQHALGDQRGVLGAGPAEGLEQHLLHLGDDRSAVAVPRHVHQARDEAPVVVPPGEQAHLLALLEVHDAGGDLEQLVDGDLEQVVARERLQDVPQLAAVVAVRTETRPLDDGVDLAPQERDVDGAGPVGEGGVEADEVTFAGHLAAVVDHLHADVLEVVRAVDGAAGIGLGDQQQRRLVEAGPHQLRQVGHQP